MTVRPIVAAFVRLPDVPVIVTFDVPIAAVALAVSVSELVAAVAPRANVAVTPAGRPDVASATVPANPPTVVTVTVVLPDAPCAMPSVAGEAEIEKPDACPTATPILNVLVRLPDLPVTIAVAVPAAAVAEAVSVSVPAVAPVELNDPVTPAGNPETLKATVPAKPFCGTTAMDAVALEPGVTVTLAGFDEIVNEGALGVPISWLMSDCPEGVPHPVVRS